MMTSFSWRRPSAPLIISFIALFAVLSGSAIALNKGEVRAKHIAKNAVKTPKIADGAITAAKLADGVAVSGEQGPAGPKGDTGDEGPQGAQGRQGEIGPPGPFPDTLPSDETLRGVFGLYGTGHHDNGIEAASGDISFAYPLASAPSVKVVQKGTASSPPECPGTAASPEAAPGWLCVYENREQNQRSGIYPDVSAPGSASSPTASRYGASIIVQGQASGTGWFFWSEGTWAVTAP